MTHFPGCRIHVWYILYNLHLVNLHGNRLVTGDDRTHSSFLVVVGLLDEKNLFNLQDSGIPVISSPIYTWPRFFVSTIFVGFAEEHFYLECNAALAIPGEQDEFLGRSIWANYRDLKTRSPQMVN